MDVREKLVELLKEIVAIQECGFGDPRPTYETVASYLMSHGVTVQEWISVTERLPEPFESVLVFRDGKITIDRNEENGWFAYDFNGKRATHWMPIPKPPKGE